MERYLRDLERRLEVPYPERAEVLAELAAHLEDLVAEARAHGASQAEAEATAVRTLAVDDAVLADLDAVHAPAVRRALAALPAPLSLVVEHLGVGGLAAAAITITLIEEEAMLGFFAEGGLFMVPLHLMGLAIVAIAGERLFSLWISRDHSRANLDRRQSALRFLGTATALVGVLGTLVGYLHALGAADRIIAEQGVFPMLEVSRIALSTTVWGLTLSLVALVVWYGVRATAERIEAMRP